MRIARIALVLAVTLIGAHTAGCNDLERRIQEQNKETFQKEVTNNHSMIVPSWYKEKYAIKAAGWGPGYYNRFHVNLLLLCLLLYPLLWTGLVYVFNPTRIPEGDLSETWGLYAFFAVFFAGCTYIVVLIISLLFSGVSFLVLGFLSDQGYYVPFDLVSFCLHILILMVLTFTIASRVIPASWKIKLPGLHIETSYSFKTKIKIHFRPLVMLKAVIVLLLSALASQIAGWVAGLIIMGVGAGFAFITTD